MKKNVLSLFLGLLLCAACSEHESVVSQSNNGNRGTLSYEWSSQQVGDTVFLICAETLRYEDDSGWHTLYPKATVKLWTKEKTVSFEQSRNPTPIYLKTSINSGYDGFSPRCRSVQQDLFFDDGQIICAEICSELYSYISNGRELFYPHVELQELIFSKSSVQESSQNIVPTISLLMPWSASDGSGNGKKELSISYVKTPVANKDQLLSTSYSKQIEWIDNNLFRLAIIKESRWEIAGLQSEKNVSPILNFSLQNSENQTLDVSNFDFKDVVSSATSDMQEVGNENWRIKKGLVTQTIRFSNGSEYLENVFSYPVYDASITWDNQTFYFDLSMLFNETYHITKSGNDVAELINTGSILLDGHSCEKAVTSSLKLKKEDPNKPDRQDAKYGKILGFAVSAVFDQAGINSGNITKKCVLVHYEQGYEWGICEYAETFPAFFTFTQSTYDAFNSAAKSSETADFQLAKAVDSANNIIWYDSMNKKISGIAAITCKIYGWENIVNGSYASTIDSYTSQISDDGYTITLTAPNGKKKTFSSLP